MGDFLILCCDGVFDVMSNEDCAKFVMDAVDKSADDLGMAAASLIHRSHLLNTQDNVTAMVVQLAPGEVCYTLHTAHTTPHLARPRSHIARQSAGLGRHGRCVASGELSG